jgi:hypothetical protein
VSPTDLFEPAARKEMLRFPLLVPDVSDVCMRHANSYMRLLSASLGA